MQRVVWPFCGSPQSSCPDPGSVPWGGRGPGQRPQVGSTTKLTGNRLSRFDQVNLITFSFVCFLPIFPFLCLFPSLTLQYKSVFRSYSQDFVPHSPASARPSLPPTSSPSAHFPPVHQSQSSDLAVPAVASPPPSAADGPLSSSQESALHGDTVCLPSETSFTDSPQTPSVRTQHTHLHAGLRT